MWYDNAEPTRAPTGGLNEFGRHYTPGEFTPFYVPRMVMPQVDSYDRLVSFANDNPVITQRANLDASTIKPHQRIDVRKAMSMSSDTLNKPILISSDMYIIDGHHRWYEHMSLHIPISAYQIALDFEPAVAFTFKFPETYSYGDGHEHAFVA